MSQKCKGNGRCSVWFLLNAATTLIKPNQAKFQIFGNGIIRISNKSADVTGYDLEAQLRGVTDSFSI